MSTVTYLTQDDVADQFAHSYVRENDDIYAKANIPIDPAFVREVLDLVSLIGTGALMGIGGKLGADVYQKIKEELHKKKSQQRPAPPKIIILEGEDRDKTILDFGTKRPFFRIGKGNNLILKNLTIKYKGKPLNVFEEEIAPSFFPINVRFVQY